MLRVAFVLRSTEVHPEFFWFVDFPDGCGVGVVMLLSTTQIFPPGGYIEERERETHPPRARPYSYYNITVVVRCVIIVMLLY